MDESFDFIVVGAGSAGCVLADALSESGRHSVLLLEAGGEGKSLALRIPALYARTFTDKNVNWMDATEPEAGMKGRPIYLPSGKVLGGSGAINAMVYVRGAGADYDAWAAEGNAGWSWNEVEKTFRALESSDAGSNGSRGRDGPLKIGRAEQHPLSGAFFAGLEELGVAGSPDYNGGRQDGYGPYEINVSRGRRTSGATAFLSPALKRRNLAVRTGAQVARVLLSERCAVGVEYVRGRRMMRAAARREVVLSAGALRSPQLLHLSGIGPAEMLRAHGITVEASLASVGRNLQDHTSCLLAFTSRAPSLNTELNSFRGRTGALLRFAMSGGGPIGSSLFSSGAFVHSRKGLERADLQLIFVPASFTGVGRKPGGGMRLDPMSAFSILAAPLQPTSRGEVALKNGDFHFAPAIRPNYLATSEDVESMVAGVRYVEKLTATGPMRAVTAGPLGLAPASLNDGDLAAFVRQAAGSVFHPVGTCRMGPDAASAVVDTRLKVHGFEHLRVVDCSIMPRITSGNTNAPAMMIGARGAEFILADAAAEARA